MKVIIFTNDMCIGGTQRVILNWLRCTNVPAADIRICTIWGPGELAAEAETLGTAVTNLDLPSCGYIGACRRAYRLMREFQPDAISCMTDGARALMPVVAKLAGVRGIVMSWGNPNIKRDRRIYALERIQAWFANGKHAVSTEVRDNVASMFRSRTVEIVRNGVDLSNYPDPPPKAATGNPLKILSVGALRPAKNHAQKVHIAKELSKTGRPFTIEIAGEGPLRPDLEALIAAHDMQDRVKLLGNRNDIPELLRNSDIYLATSTHEGFGLANIEAFASATPVVVYDIPPLQDIDPDSNAFVRVANGDYRAAAGAIAELATNESERNRLGSAGRRIVASRYTAEQSTNEWLQAMRRCCAMPAAEEPLPSHK